MPELELISLTVVDPWLTSGVEDWAVLLGLYQYRPRKIHGFITNDDKMLALSRTLPVLAQTDLTLLVIAGVGHEPVSATGLLLLHAPAVAARWTERPELVVVQSPPIKANEFSKFLTTAAMQHDLAPGPFRKKFQLEREQLTTPLKDWYVPQREE
jgi:hypothetical protein